MRQPGCWADHLAVKAVGHYLRRPIIIWCLACPHQLPALLLPEPATLEPATAVYVLLDESSPGAEHYSALLLAQGRGNLEQMLAAARAQRAKRAVQPKGLTHKSLKRLLRGQHGEAGGVLPRQA